MGEQRDSKNLSYLEFYSGVGGWTMAMEEACRNIGSSTLPPLKRLGSFDHSDICNNVLHYNFPENDNEKKVIEPVKLEDMREKPRKRKKGSKKSDPRKIVAIEKLTRSFLEEKKALIWSMSPPCQPHTRQHANQEEDMNDPRSKSFLHLCQMLREMDFSTLPRCILLENVIGFENVSLDQL
jgi:tRNA (cytosine38-C5)-methyltransferase